MKFVIATHASVDLVDASNLASMLSTYDSCIAVVAFGPLSNRTARKLYDKMWTARHTEVYTKLVETGGSRLHVTASMPSCLVYVGEVDFSNSSPYGWYAKAWWDSREITATIEQSRQKQWTSEWTIHYGLAAIVEYEVRHMMHLKSSRS